MVYIYIYCIVQYLTYNRTFSDSIVRAEKFWGMHRFCSSTTAERRWLSWLNVKHSLKNIISIWHNCFQMQHWVHDKKKCVKEKKPWSIFLLHNVCPPPQAYNCKGDGESNQYLDKVKILLKKIFQRKPRKRFLFTSLSLELVWILM